MRLKYYLRGLGLGIVVTAIIMGVAASKNRRMTDEEIVARAKQLGMIEGTVLTEGMDREDNDEQPEDTENENDTGNETENQADAGQSEPVEATTQPQPKESEPDIQANSNALETDTDVDNREKEAESSEPDTQSDADASETGDAESEISRVIIINSGEGSYTVSKKLAEIGAVESAADFDTYLCENGYDKKIRAGTYTIPADASDEQMAKIVTGAKITE